MNTKQQMAGKTAMNRTMQRTTRKRRITFTVNDEQYANLERIAGAMNNVQWTCCDNTAESVFNLFVRPLVENCLDSPAELCELISSGIATSDDTPTAAPEPIHTARIAELRNAFDNL